jgi:hypothetical protein
MHSKSALLFCLLASTPAAADIPAMPVKPLPELSVDLRVARQRLLTATDLASVFPQARAQSRFAKFHHRAASFAGDYLVYTWSAPGRELRSECHTFDDPVAARQYYQGVCRRPATGEQDWSSVLKLGQQCDVLNAPASSQLTVQVCLGRTVLEARMNGFSFSGPAEASQILKPWLARIRSR